MAIPIAEKRAPIRAELYTVDRLVELAKELAASHDPLGGTPRPDLYKSIKKNERALQSIDRALTQSVAAGSHLSPAGEWLVDNFHFVTAQMRGIREDLPKDFYRELPALTKGPFAGYPRVYDMALQLIAHTDSRLDPDVVRNYIDAYQEVRLLGTGELWAIAILFRVALIENLTRIMEHSEQDRLEEERAETLVHLLREVAGRDPKELEDLLAMQAQNLKHYSHSFLAHLVLRLREEGTALLPAMDWLLNLASSPDADLDELIRRRNQELATSRVSVSNIITSLRLLASIDWTDLVEETSAIEAKLREDPAGYYTRCDFATRDRYRHAIEQITRGSASSETEVAAALLQLARDAQQRDGADARTAHIGYYLVDEGRIELERLTRYRPGIVRGLKRMIQKYPGLFYHGLFLALTFLIEKFLFQYASLYSTNLALVLLAVFLGLIPATALSLVIVNWIVTLFFKPRVLPKLDFKNGIPGEFRTVVVVPTILTDEKEVSELVSRLEVHYLANHDDNLDFAILSDYVDAQTATTPNDEKVLQKAMDGIGELNRRYPRSHTPRFHLYHRARKWNENEGKWMGWERKRGKLEEFNRLLLGDSKTTYLPAKPPEGIQFVITADSDTILPRDSARKLVGTLAHPLQRPVVDPVTHHVVKGYGILQPRVSHTLTSANRTWFARFVCGPSGIDPYTQAVSDIYQDLFGEASFVGKGIYDLRAFHQSVDGRFPENALLSHDLIEGSFARAGLVSDIEVFDDQPSNYLSSILREHRWARGDWQLLPWLLPRVPDSRGNKTRNTLSWLNRWKLFDNLRRSLLAPGLFILLVAGWSVLPGSPLFWTLFSLTAVLAGTVLPFLTGLMSMNRAVHWFDQVRALVHEMGRNILHSILKICFLANDAFAMLDAIFRTFFRLARKRKLLEWVTASHAERAHGRNIASFVVQMVGSVILAACVYVLVLLFRPNSLPFAMPFVAVWFASPLIALLTGQRIHHARRSISDPESATLRSHALDIWYYFATLVGDEDQWLPPDNIQETPHEQIAHRTSPTNIGFALLANIAAYDFGYIGITEFVERTERTLTTLSRMNTFNGHLFNWYDTRTLTPLEPRYVSTVDSGNLTAALMVLKQFARNHLLLLQPGSQRFSGICDHVQKLLSSAERNGVSAEHQNTLREILRFVEKSGNQNSGGEEVLQWVEGVLPEIKPGPAEKAELSYWWEACSRVVASHLSDYSRPQDLRHRLTSIASEAEELIREMDFRFLFDEDRGLFSIGFNVTWGRLDASYYDLLASESRLASLVAIAKGDVPQSHWFRMSRTMMSRGGYRVLTSWSGSMFEYLMPLLFVQNEPNTLLDETYRGVVKLHQKYASSRRVPWGISEAAFNTRDAATNYQYGPFGVPGLGLKPGLAQDLVVAPYATFLAAMVDPQAAVRNLAELEQLGMRGRFGLYESVDFTRERIGEAPYEIIRAYMVHHMGMSLIALDNILQNNIMQHRFHSDPSIKATRVLLQERLPLGVRAAPIQLIDNRPQLFRLPEPVVAREFHSPHLTPPPAQVLSNGSYRVVLTSAGSGYSHWRGLQITRWQEDGTRDHQGSWIYVRDYTGGAVWSAGFQPARTWPSFYRARFAEDVVEYRRRDGDVETHTDVTISPEEDAEVRRVTLINTGSEAVEIEVTSYQEIVLTTGAADLAHRTFSNLFVETEFLPEPTILVAGRRLRAPADEPCWAAHAISCEGEMSSDLQYETDRARFIGRGRDASAPAAMDGSTPLSKTTGAVLDPIFSLRSRVKIAPYSREVISFTTVVAGTREQVIALATKYRDPRAVSRAFEVASSHASVTFHQLGLTQEDAHLFQRILGRLIYLDLSLRPRPAVLARNVRTQSTLWGYGISGDHPICLVRVEASEELDIVRQLLRAHEYWRSKGYTADLVILNEFASSYFQELQDELTALIRASSANALQNKPGGIFVLRSDQIPEEDRILLRTIARVQIVAQRGSLAAQIARVERRDPLPPLHKATVLYPMEDPPLEMSPSDQAFDNGYGGFSADGREYRIRWNQESQTPAPWINVISNPNFGFHVSERGSGMTWSVNSRENRLTPWSNDTVSDPATEVFYVRDEESGHFWSATPAPAPGKGNYWISHGAGYTRFSHGGQGIEHELLMFVSPDQSVKLMKLRLNNRTRRNRRLSVTFYTDLVMGMDRSHSAPFVITSVDKDTGAMLAVNRYNNEFAGRVLFATINDKHRTITGDRTVFLGPGGSPADPDAMHRAFLSGSIGAGLDPCLALQGRVSLGPLSEHTFVFLLGEGSDLQEARKLIRRYADVSEVNKEWERTQKEWESTLGAVQVHTPDQSMNVLLNRWLLYQAISCRFWARSAFYQSSGAFGFRDQLQDALAFVHSRPEVLREHLLRAASRQFEEGDVQHWWHPPTGRGVRTTISDDLLWLPYCATYYVNSTGDRGVLDEMAPFVTGKHVEPPETDAYFEPGLSENQASLYDHCLRTIDRSLEMGKHGLPLMGSGDWNDGMNRLGIQGRGESVWLAWFLIRILNDFAPLCEERQDPARAARYREVAEYLGKAIDLIAWDGEWYLRGYDDDGDPFGSSRNEECRIDSIAQSWAVLSGAGNPEKIRKAIASVEKHLLLPEEQMLLLFTPPFLKSEKDPGYIMSYPAGLRENGGQYNHAATWMMAAYCELGEGDKAYRVFNFLNPILRSSTRSRADKYRLEPYAVAADIYFNPAHIGRGGWSWYTGSAAWLYRSSVEWMLGLRLKGDHFSIEPSIPKHWPEYRITYKRGATEYQIQVDNLYQQGRGVKSVELDGARLAENKIPLLDDGKTHSVRVILG